MDKGTWIGITLLCILTLGLVYLMEQVQNNNGSSQSATSAPSVSTQTTTNNTSQTTNTTGLDCQTIANEAAQNNQTKQGQTTTVIQAHLNQSLNQCYYELNIFTASGDETDIRVAPNDTIVAYCITIPSGLSCQKPGVGAITEPQFKQFLKSYFTN